MNCSDWRHFDCSIKIKNTVFTTVPVNFLTNYMSELKEEELKKEAKRLGWTVEQLRQHLAKEKRITTLFENLRKEQEEEPLRCILGSNHFVITGFCNHPDFFI